MESNKRKICCWIWMILLALGMSVLYFLNCYAHADNCGYYELVQDYYDYGLGNSLFSSPYHYLNPEAWAVHFCYFLFGKSILTSLIPMTLDHFICMLLAFYLITEGKSERFWSLAIYCFLLLPSFAMGIQVSVISDPYKIMWWKYTHSIPTIGVLIALIFFRKLELSKMQTWKKYGIYAGTIAVLLVWTMYCYETLLFVEVAICAIPVYICIYYFKDFIIWMRKRKRNIALTLAVLAALLAMMPMAFKKMLELLGDVRGSQYISISFSKETIANLCKLALAFFDAHEYGGGLLGSNPLYLVKILFLILGGIVVVWNIVQAMIHRKKVSCLDLMASIQCVVNVGAGILTGTGFRYGRPTLYLLGIVLCRTLLSIIPKQKVRLARNGSIALCVVFCGIAIFNAYQTRTNFWINSNTSDYEACLEFKEYALANDLKYGFSENGEIDLLEIYSEGLVDVTHTTKKDNEIVLINPKDYRAILGGNYTNFYLDSTIYSYANIEGEDVIAEYGDNYIDKVEYFNSLGEPYADLYVYDYDIRVKPFSIYPQNAAHQNVYDLRDQELQYETDLDLGSYRLEIEGENLQNTCIKWAVADEEITIEEVQSEESSLVYLINCKKSSRLLFSAEQGDAKISGVQFFCTYAAVDILTGETAIASGETISIQISSPCEEYNIVLWGEQLKRIDIGMSENVDYTIGNIGRKGAMIHVMNATPGEICTLSLKNGGRKESILLKIDYEIELAKRQNYEKFEYIVEAKDMEYTDAEIHENEVLIHPGCVQSGPFLTLPQGGYMVRVEGLGLEKAIFEVGYTNNGEFHEFGSAVSETGQDYVILEFYADQFAEGVEIRMRNETEEDMIFYAYCVK